MLKKIMKLALTPLLISGLTLGGLDMASAAPEVVEENQPIVADLGLSNLQIREKMDEINSRYEVGEKFTEEDANFVKQYANSLSENRVQTSALDLWDRHHTFSGSYGNVEGFGFIKVKFHPLGGNFEGLINAQTSDGSKRNDLGVEANFTVYGLVGTDGFGKIFDRDYSKNDTNSNYVSLNFADSYSGVAHAFYYTYRGFVDGNSFLMSME